MLEASVTPLSTNRFLLVEDDESNLRGMQRLVRPFGEVVMARDYAAGVRAIAETDTSWTAMFVDKVLPGGSGLTLIAHARERYPLVPILLITGHTDHAATNTALRLDVRIMAKPIEADLVRRFCAESSARVTAEELDRRIARVVQSRAQASGLSPAELHIFLRACQCHAMGDIAAERRASEETVRKQVASIRLKLGVESLHHAVLQVLRTAVAS